MKWFSGDIASAITLAKTRGAIFVVYCEGQDENSKQLTELIDNESISKKLESKDFVAIKIQSDKEEYMNFAKIYQIVPVPSLFFIKNGIPIKIVTSTVKTLQELEEAISAVIKNEASQKQNAPSPSAPSASNSSTATSTPSEPQNTEVVCEGGVCYKKPKDSTKEDTEPVQPAPNQTDTEEEKQEKIKKAMKLIEQKRVERIQEEQRLEKEKEIRRRKEGQEMQDLKKWQEDQELKQLKEDRMREKQEAKAARQRVLDQIEQDKKERAQRFGGAQPASTEEKPTPPVVTPPTTPASNTARIQFKKPSGETEIVTFDADMLFSDLHLFVKNDVLHGAVKEFTLCTTFPRREFTQEDFKSTLAELSLTPSAVLLIIPGKFRITPGPAIIGGGNILPTQTDGGLTSMLYALVLGLFSPVWAVFSYVKSFIFRAPAAGESANDVGKRKRNEEVLAPNDAAKKRNLSAFNSQPTPGTSNSSPTGTIPKTTAFKRQNSSNIHRLHQNDSDDEEKKTYNGNSTQQM